MLGTVLMIVFVIIYNLMRHFYRKSQRKHFRYIKYSKYGSNQQKNIKMIEKTVLCLVISE